MYVRIAALALILALTVALPLAAHAGRCQSVVVFFSGPKDLLDIINLDSTINVTRHVSFTFMNNDGTGGMDTAVPIKISQRLEMSAQAVYATLLQPPAITGSYVHIRLSPVAYFSATVTQGGQTRELLCVNP